MRAFVAVVLVITFAAFAVNLDTYPPFFEDEPFFNASAVRVLEGRPFSYELCSEAPHSVDVWAYHGPLFFRMQIPIMKALGISHFACRLPSFLCAHIAVFLLCLAMIRWGAHWGAVFLAVGWMGDRSLLEVLLGRPEGVCLLLVTMGGLCFVHAARRRRTVEFVMSGIFLGISAGVNPGGAYFALAAAASVLLLLPPRMWLLSLGALAAGGALAATLCLLFWLPDVHASYEQFSWYVGLSTAGSAVEKLRKLFSCWSLLQLSRFWVFFLLLSTTLWAIPSILRDRLKRHEVYMDRSILLLRGVSAMFSIAGVLMYLSSSRNPYYFVMFSLWPMTLLSTFLHFGGRSRRRTILVLVWIAFAACCWISSMFWNAMRCREGWIWRDTVSKTAFSERLSEIGVGAAEVFGDPVFFIAAHNAGVKYTPLPFYDFDTGMNPPPDSWLLLTPRYRDILSRSQYQVIESRSIITNIACFSDNEYWKTECIVYGPKSVGSLSK